MNFSFRRRSTLMLGLAVMLTGLFASAALLPGLGETSDQLACQQDPTDTDSDGDGLSDTIERSRFPLDYLNDQFGNPKRVKTAIDNPDSDGDGLCDGEEFHGFTVVTKDIGVDGKAIELEVKTDPKNWDTDLDGVADGKERDAGTDPTNPEDFPEKEAAQTVELTLTPTPTPRPTATPVPTATLAQVTHKTSTLTPPPDLTLDSDGDGLTDGAELGGFTVTINGQERTMVTDQLKQDTDGDNLPDGEEVRGFTIRVAGIERTVKTDPKEIDSDGDGKSDFDEKLGWSVGRTFGSPQVVTDPTLADTDGDGTQDVAQAYEGRDPTETLLLQDHDQDGLTNGQELDGSKITIGGVERVVKSDPTLADTDGDNLSDGDEVKGREITVNGEVRLVQTDPNVTDTDGDGLSDLEESVRGMDGGKPDTDGDGLSDADEIAGFEITVTLMGAEKFKKWVNPSPIDADTDGDGLTDDAEMTKKTDPGLADSDGDGLSDSREQEPIPFVVVDPLTKPIKADSDADGLSDGLESVLKTNPMHHDTDGDGLTDWQEVAGMPVTIGGEEVIVRSNPLSYDSDGDGLSDSDEINGFEMTIGDDTVTVTTNPLSGDTDADGLSDAEERNGKTISVNGTAIDVVSNPTKRDTDGDTISDRLELQGYVIKVGDEDRTVKTNPMKQDTDGDGKNDDQERDGWAIAGKDSPTFKTDPTLKDTDGDGKPDSSPDGAQSDENPVEADEGIAGLILGPLLASGIPYSAVGLLIIVAGAVTFRFAKWRQDTSADSTQRRLRDQGRELDESRRSLNDLQREYAREIGQLRSDVDDRDRRLREFEAQLQTYQGAAQRREQELGTTASRLAQSANELGEREWVAEIVANLPSAAQPGNGLDDRFTVMTALGRRLDEIRGQASTQRVRARDLISELGRLGLETGGIRRALESAPATALPSLIGSLEELVRQHTVESMDKDRLLSEIQRAEGLCNREITDAVGRRVPLQFLARARELAEQATSQAEMNAAIVAGDRILDDIYRFYFPRSSR